MSNETVVTGVIESREAAGSPVLGIRVEGVRVGGVPSAKHPNSIHLAFNALRRALAGLKFPVRVRITFPAANPLAAEAPPPSYKIL